MAIGDYEKLETARRSAWRQQARAPWGSEEHKTLERFYEELAERRAAYLRELLARLPFRWYIAHAHTGRATMSYEGGADHIVVDEPVHIGRLKREPGDALSRPARKFWGLYRTDDRSLPTSLADIKIAERIVETSSTEQKPKKTAKQLNRDIAEVIGRGK